MNKIINKIINLKKNHFLHHQYYNENYLNQLTKMSLQPNNIVFVVIILIVNEFGCQKNKKKKTYLRR